MADERLGLSSSTRALISEALLDGSFLIVDLRLVHLQISRNFSNNILWSLRVRSFLIVGLLSIFGLRNTFIPGIDLGQPLCRASRFRACHGALSALDGVSNVCILLAIDHGSLLVLVLRVLAADRLVDEDENDEGDDACKHEQDQYECLGPLLFLRPLVSFHFSISGNLSDGILLSEGGVDLEFEGPTLSLVLLFVDVSTDCIALLVGRHNAEESDCDIIFGYVTQSMFDWGRRTSGELNEILQFTELKRFWIFKYLTLLNVAVAFWIGFD